MRSEGLVTWTHFRGNGDFYNFYCGCILSGLGYIHRKNLQCGRKFGLALSKYDYFLEHLELSKKRKIEYKKYFKKT